MDEGKEAPGAGKPLKLLESVYVIEQTFDGMTVRGALVIGARRALIFDTLYFPQKTKELLALCSGREVVVVYSHADYDHVWGTCDLLPARIIAQEECARRFADSSDVKGTLEDFRAKYEGALADIELIAPQETFQANTTIDLGGISVELRHCPGHTKDSIVAIVPERALLLGADCIEMPLPLLNEGAEHLVGWIQALLELEQDTRITTCVPSHGAIGGREIIKHNIEYLRSLFSHDEAPLDGLDEFYTRAHRDNRHKVAALRS